MISNTIDLVFSKGVFCIRRVERVKPVIKGPTSKTQGTIQIDNLLSISTLKNKKVKLSNLTSKKSIKKRFILFKEGNHFNPIFTKLISMSSITIDEKSKIKSKTSIKFCINNHLLYLLFLGKLV
jgi:hypothetical protein